MAAINQEVVDSFKGALIEKDLRDSFNKYKNVKAFGQNLKDKVKEKKNFYKDFYFGHVDFHCP